jgi:tetratricopeptide (TPR) repeat protein
VATKNVLRRTGEERVIAASLLGVVGAFYFGAGVEWIWQLSAVAGIGIACLALLVGPAGSSEALRPVANDARPAARRVPRFAIGLIALAIGWLVLCAQAIPWLADLQLKASAAAIGRNDGRSALTHALDAKSIQPWAASPYLQLALVDEQRGDLNAAHSWIEKAIQRNPVDWRLWLVAARLETKRSDLPAARKSLRRAEDLNPRSPLFESRG